MWNLSNNVFVAHELEHAVTQASALLPRLIDRRIVRRRVCDIVRQDGQPVAAHEISHRQELRAMLAMQRCSRRKSQAVYGELRAVEDVPRITTAEKVEARLRCAI